MAPKDCDKIVSGIAGQSTGNTQRKAVFGMATVLLLVIYIAFIGLGIPDSLFGAAWPAIYAELGLPLASGTVISVTVCCGTILSSLLSARVIARFGTGRVAAFSTALTALALLGYSFSHNLGFLCLFALPLGLGAGAIDIALNNYVALHYSAAHMNFLHCFYGVGVSISPYVLAVVIQSSGSWRGGYRTACVMQLAIALLLVVTLPLWNRAHGPAGAAQEESPQRVLSFRQTLRIPGVGGMCLLFLTSCGIEYTCGNWGSTFLVETRQMSVDQAARMIVFYYIGIAVGRFLSGLLSVRLGSWKIIALGQGTLGVAVVLLLLPAPAAMAGLELFLVGLGNGPMFPNFNYLTPLNFGRDVSQSVMGTQMAASYVGIMVVPAVFGLLGQQLGTGLFPAYLLLFYLVMAAATRVVKTRLHPTI